MDWVGQILGAGLNFYNKKQQDKADAKTALINFQLQKQQLQAATAQANAQAAASNAQAAASSSKPAASGGVPKWVIPTVAGVAVVGVLFLVLRPSKAA